MDLTDFRLLVGIVDTGSVTRGAERAFLSLPAASNRVKQLESELAVSLLTRSSRGVTPTPAGIAFSQHARTILRELESLSYQEIADELELPVSTVRGAIARARKALAVAMAEWR